MLLCCLCAPAYSALTSINETDRMALVAFKSAIISDPYQILSSWNDSLSFCQWQGITCSRRHHRVTVLSLPGLKLRGTISARIANLSFLRGIDLRDNFFHGQLPPQLGRLPRLMYLNLSRNSINGEIPANLSRCSNLRVINLDANDLVGAFPVELTNFPNLLVLNLTLNNLTGAMSPSLGNLTSLRYLSFARNSLEGSIPSELGQLRELDFLQLSLNFLHGTISSSLYNLTKLSVLGLTGNQLNGTLHPQLGLIFPTLRVLLVGMNEFIGSIPVTLSNASRLKTADFGGNNFSGKVPTGLGMLKGLTFLSFSRNRLGEGDDLSFITSLVNCTRLEALGLERNLFGGRLPESLSNLSSQLSVITMGSNQIFGSIPSGMGNLVRLESFDAQENLLTGSIPLSIGKLPRLQLLGLSRNRLSGQIPSTLCNNSLLLYAYLGRNNFEGNIPSTMGNCQNLLELVLLDNKLNGTIPREVLLLPSLSVLLSLSYNFLSGPLPSEIGNLKNLWLLFLSNNKLTGEIPSALGSCESLETLDLGNNFFQGAIPPSLRKIKNLQEADLSSNNLSGQIPKFLGEFRFLRFLNLSFNNMEGEVPIDGVFKNESAISITGNTKLCGGPLYLHLSACPVNGTRKFGYSDKMRIIIPVVSSVGLISLILCLVVGFYWKRKSRNEIISAVSSSLEKFKRVSYKNLFEATNGFSAENLIGSGSYGSVYVGTLTEISTPIAVKVLNLQFQGSSKSFMTECKAMSSIRHRNLVQILTSCSSQDSKGNDFKALVFEFMSNGSLDKWLHPTNDGNQQDSLTLIQRLNVAIDVALAVDYLHNQCQTPIIHCDLKPSNILLDDEMTAHVADFGLAKFLYNEPSRTQSSTVALRGTIGYVPPEYGSGCEVSMHGDVHSYGILLLETFIRKRPTDAMFKNGLSLHQYAEMALPDRVAEVLDPQLLLTDEPFSSGKITATLASVLEIGVVCSSQSPKAHPNMAEVLRKMQAIREVFVRTGDYEC